MSDLPGLPELGVGIMYFPGLERVLEAGASNLDVIEVEPQPLCRVVDGTLRLRPEVTEFLIAQPQAKLVHSVGAPVAGTVHAVDMLDPVAEAVDAFHSPWASEHLNFDRVADDRTSYFTSFLLPQIQSDQAVDVAVANIEAMHDRLGVPIAVETPVNYLSPWPGELSDGAFLAEIIERAECGLLLDLHNVWCNERNGRQLVLDLLDELPLDRVWEVHLAGGQLLDGYWVDAHSGLVDPQLWELSEEVIRRLPHLKAINFEVMPEYLTSGRLDPDAVSSELAHMQDLWRMRGSKCPREASRSVSSATRPRSLLPDCVTWERSVGASVTGRPAVDAWPALQHDPGMAVYRKMVRSVRVGVVVDTLRLTYRMLALSIGPETTEALLDDYLAAAPAHPAAPVEAEQFVDWLHANGPAITDLIAVAEFELALIATQTDRQSAHVLFSREPIQLLEALGAGRLPADATTSGDFVLDLTP